MGKRISIHKKGISSLLIYPAITLWLLSGCATSPSNQEVSSATYEEPVIESIHVVPSQTETLLKITSSKPARYQAFKLYDPERIILDIRGNPSDYLPEIYTFTEGIGGVVRFTEGATQALTTRMIILPQKEADYLVTESDNIIQVSLTPKHKTSTVEEPKQTDLTAGAGADSEKVTISEPRIFFKPKPSPLNQVLGIDFTMLDHGKSRLTLTTDKKINYDLWREGEKSLVLSLSETTIPPLLLRHLDTIHFRSSIDNVKQKFSPATNETTLHINLKEMVPFHINQVDTNLFIDFGKTSIKPPVKQIIPLNLAEARTMELAADQKMTATTTTTPATTAVKPAAVKPTPAKGEEKKGFTGEPMYLDFVNADVTHILRLINEVAEENIIWDPVIAGKKVSMILKDVPWDEALELILQNNNLAKRYVGDNIIWITTKAKMKQIEAEERAEEERIRQQELERIKSEQKKEEVQAPLITEYIPLDFARAGEVRPHIIMTERGKISIDKRTNTIIINDTADSIEQAKKTISQFDTPVKQIMIEARIVDATDDLTKSLGITWGATASRTDTDGDSVSGTFVTHSPAGWVSNVGLAVTQLNGLTTYGLDAVLALNEAEGKSKTLSAPKVIAREGTSANISSGDTLIIDATENVASTTIDATLSLTVTPTSVSYNDFITLDVVVTDDRAPSSDRILTKSISTTLMIKSGDTVVIGGIIKESDSKNVNGIIGLKDIPIVGNLFKAKQSVFTRSELLIFLTPKVLPFSSDVY